MRISDWSSDLFSSDLVTIEGAMHTAGHDGATHYFCSARCKDKFVAEPEHYLSGAHLDQVDEVPEGTIYTCPMHPELRQVGPGSCTICRMAVDRKSKRMNPSHLCEVPMQSMV